MPTTINRKAAMRPPDQNARSRPVVGGGPGEVDRSGESIGTTKHNDAIRRRQASRIALRHLLPWPTARVIAELAFPMIVRAA